MKRILALVALLLVSSLAQGQYMLYNSRSAVLGGTVGGNLTVNGNLSVLGDTALGDASGDTLTINAGTWTYGSNWTATRNAGTVVAGTSSILQNSVTYTGDAGGTSLTNANVWTTTASVTNPINQVRNAHFQLVSNAASSRSLNLLSTVNFANSNSTTADHIFFTSNFNGTGTIGTFSVANVQAPGFSAAQPVTTFYALNIGNLGNANIGTAAGVRMIDFTGSATARGIWSSLASGTGKHNLYIDGTADNYIAGSLGVGIGALPPNYTRLYFSGAFTSGGASNTANFMRMDGSLTAAAGDTAAVSFMRVNPTTVTGGAGEAYNLITSAHISQPNITFVGGDTAAIAATLYISDAPTGATTNDAIHVASGTSRFGGALLAANGTSSAPAYAFSGATGTGIYRTSINSHLGFARAGAAGPVFMAYTQGVLMGSAMLFGWSNNTDPDAGVIDISLFRGGSGILEQRNGTNAQSLRVYNTFTDTTTYERGFLKWSSNVFEIGTEQGSASNRQLSLRSATGKVLLQPSGTAASQLAAAQTTVPTCSTNCGTSPSVSGSDTAGIVTMGSSGSPASGWVVTFNGTWTSAPACVVQSSRTGMVAGKAPIVVATSTTTFTVTTNGTAPGTADTYAYHCIGVQ